jgi:hypothetical protein
VQLYAIASFSDGGSLYSRKNMNLSIQYRKKNVINAIGINTGMPAEYVKQTNVVFMMDAYRSSRLKDGPQTMFSRSDCVTCGVKK